MTVQVSQEQLEVLRDTLLNTAGDVPLHARFRALFMLKAVGGEQVVGIIADALKDPSSLIKHELAYVLGQMGHPSAIPILEQVLINPEGKHCPMVRHEAAEALGALSSQGSLSLLRKYLDDPAREVRETCEIAISKIEWDVSEEGKKKEKNLNFPTIDPAPAKPNQSIQELRTDLLNTKLPLFERYRAMFALRDFGAGDKVAVEALADGFNDGSALFRHEIAYIFGQLCSPYSIPSLLSRLRDPKEEEMVRHEAAEALGGIASDGVENEELPSERSVLDILKEWAVKEDAPIVVRESCQVAIDMWEYENSNEQFNPLDLKVATTGMERSAHIAVTAGLTS
ncbi:deoxyhypusine hydroxylase [Tremella mesenterica]|uniref:Deoxyhypusine hydroxylase n=1 Tax=Tremella mesenterica TaxID=5217 RepID=A0A4Q1BPS5_TREME|nr:deoxyhypusine hydroxylase [Tremella mesenterica]